MEVSEKGLIEIVGHEGLCLRPYLDSVGVWTLGVGHTASEEPDPAKMSKTEYITVKEALDLFKTDIKRYSSAVNKALTVKVSQEQFDALVSLCYNIGTGGLKNSTLIKYINGHLDKSAINTAFLMWRKPPEILGRRKKEAALYLTGKYQNNGKALQFDTDGKGKVLHKKGKTIDVAKLF